VYRFLDGLVRGTKTVMTRVELGGPLFLVAVIGVLLTSRAEEDESSYATCGPGLWCLLRELPLCGLSEVPSHLCT
jgi:hypothetical protein